MQVASVAFAWMIAVSPADASAQTPAHEGGAPAPPRDAGVSNAPQPATPATAGSEAVAPAASGVEPGAPALAPTAAPSTEFSPEPEGEPIPEVPGSAKRLDAHGTVSPRSSGGLYLRLAPGFMGVRFDGRGGAGHLYGASLGYARVSSTRGFSYMIGARFAHRYSRIELEDKATAELEHWFRPGLEVRLGTRKRRLFAFGLLTPTVLIERRVGHPTRPDGTYLGASLGVGGGVIGFVSERLFIGTEIEFVFDGFFAAYGAEFASRWTQQLQWFVMFGWAF